MMSISKTEFAVCIVDTDCADLEKGRIYAVRPDASAKREGYIRVVDASGQDYLYPEANIVFLDLPAQAKDALLTTK